jgi:hypothetical protein
VEVLLMIISKNILTDVFCNECFKSLHKNGKRQEHQSEELKQDLHHIKSMLNVVSSSITPSVVSQLPPSSYLFSSSTSSNWVERSKFISLRLTPEEHEKMRLVDGSLTVSGL